MRLFLPLMFALSVAVFAQDEASEAAAPAEVAAEPAVEDISAGLEAFSDEIPTNSVEQQPTEAAENVEQLAEGEAGAQVPEEQAAPVEAAAVPAEQPAPVEQAAAPARKRSVFGDDEDDEPVDTYDPEAAGSTAKPAKKSAKVPGTGFSLGVFAGASYNDFMGADFGLDDMDDGAEGYRLRVTGADDLTGNYWGIGFNAGIGVLYMFTPVFGLHAEVGAAYRRGVGESNVSVILEWDDDSRKPEKDDIDIEVSSSQLNIDIPVMLRVLLGGSVYVDAGVMPSINIMSSLESTVSDDRGESSFSEDDCYESFELGVIAGVGVQRSLGGKKLDLGLRFVMGLTELAKDQDAKTFQVQFNISYWLL